LLSFSHSLFASPENDRIIYIEESASNDEIKHLTQCGYNVINGDAKSYKSISEEYIFFLIDNENYCIANQCLIVIYSTSKEQCLISLLSENKIKIWNSGFPKIFEKGKKSSNILNNVSVVEFFNTSKEKSIRVYLGDIITIF
jgi:hypothetical protein